MAIRRKDFASILRQMERPIERNTSVGVASSIGGDGHTVNGQNVNDGEIRGLNFALPYGISSSGVDGIKIQIITNGNQNNVAVGVIDNNRPPVKSGCITLYDKSGQKIVLGGDGTIRLYGDVYINGLPFNDIVGRISNIESKVSEIESKI